MRRLKPPPVPEDPVPVLDDDALRQLFQTCEGRGVEERRDAAILYLFLDAARAWRSSAEIGPLCLVECAWVGWSASVAGGACRRPGQALLTSRLTG